MNDQTAIPADYPFQCQPFKTSQKMVFTIGNIGSDLIGAVISTYILYFYTNVAGLATAVASAILLVSRILDAGSDIFMGWMVDRTKSKYGKSRPWLLWMAVPYAISGALIFFAPNFSMTGKIIFALVSYNLSSTIFGTAVAVPYNTLVTVTTDNDKDRASIGIYRMLGTVIAGIIASVAIYPSVNAVGGSDDSAFGWLITMLVFGAVAGISLLVTFAFTKERIGTGVKETEPVPLKRRYPRFCATGTGCYFFLSCS